MTRFEATLALTMILAVIVVLGYAIARPAPRPTSQPEIMSSETPSPLFTPLRETSGSSTANGIAAEAWIGASDTITPSSRASYPPSGSPTSRRKEPPIAKPAHRFTPGGRGISRAVSGQATWYCCTRGHSANEYVAAAGPPLRVGAWRGRMVTVCGASCIRVRLVDWCACPGRVIDLHGGPRGPFAALGPLSRGVLRVKVSW